MANDTRTGGTVHRGNRQQQAGRQSLGILDMRLRTATVSRRRVRAWRCGVTVGWARPASSSKTRALHASKQVAAGIRGRTRPLSGGVSMYTGCGEYML